MKIFVLERSKDIDIDIDSGWLSNLSMDKHMLRYRNREDRLNSILGRLLIRFVLHHYYHCSGVIKQNTNGKLYVDHLLWKGDVSLSHSHSMIVCAVNPSGQVGVDVEKKREVNLAIVNEFLSEQEQEVLKANQSVEDKLSILFLYWTLKEAYLKALGIGIKNINLSSLEFDLTAGPQPILLEKPNYWRFFTEQISPNYQLSLCYKAPKHECIQIIKIKMSEVLTFKENL